MIKALLRILEPIDFPDYLNLSLSCCGSHHLFLPVTRRSKIFANESILSWK